MGDYSHVFRISLVVILLVIAGWLAPRWWRPESYGEIGPYRAENLGENIHLDFVLQDRQTCRRCHQEIFQTHQKDVHVTVQCERCHGTADKHIEFHQVDSNIPDNNQAVLDKVFAHTKCPLCHLKLTARPSSFPQVDIEVHYAFHHVTEDNTLCTVCHNPHEPLFLLNPFDNAQIHPLAQECRDCHENPPEKSYTEVSSHQDVLTCQQCH
ncbi:MAG: hypothetical protein GY869_03285, partial [Planctomycetes bacterium]|nr:hypothetical protein [Planctomycetota bacterium]